MLFYVGVNLKEMANVSGKTEQTAEMDLERARLCREGAMIFLGAYML